MGKDNELKESERKSPLGLAMQQADFAAKSLRNEAEIESRLAQKYGGHPGSTGPNHEAISAAAQKAADRIESVLSDLDREILESDTAHLKPKPQP